MKLVVVRLDIDPGNRLGPLFFRSEEPLRHFWRTPSFKGRLRDKGCEARVKLVVVRLDIDPGESPGTIIFAIGRTPEALLARPVI